MHTWKIAYVLCYYAILYIISRYAVSDKFEEKKNVGSYIYIYIYHIYFIKYYHIYLSYISYIFLYIYIYIYIYIYDTFQVDADSLRKPIALSEKSNFVI